MRGVCRAGAFLLLCVWVFASDQALAAVVLESSFTVTETYTDNLLYKDTNTKSDFGTFVGPNLTLQYDNPDIVIGGTYFGRVALFVNNPDENAYIQNANIILDLPFLTKHYKKLSVTIDETMNFTPQLDAFSLSGAQDASTFNDQRGAGLGSEASSGSGAGFSQGIGGTQGVFTRRASAFYNRAGITFDYAWAPRVTPSLSYFNQYRHFFKDGFQDSLIHIGTFSVPYGVTEQTTVTPLYIYRHTNFIGSSTDDTSGDKIISHQPQLEIAYNFTPLVTGSIRGGVAFTKEKGAEEFEGGTTTDLSDKWQTNFIGGATIAKTYRKGNISLTANQTIGSGGGLASQATRTRIVTGRIQHDFTLRLRGFGSVGYANNSSTEGNAFDTNTYRIQGGITYAFLSWLFGNLGYSHIDQNSDGSAADDLKSRPILSGGSRPWPIPGI